MAVARLVVYVVLLAVGGCGEASRENADTSDEMLASEASQASLKLDSTVGGQGFAQPEPVPAPDSILEVALEKQAGRSWCWAAATRMALHAPGVGFPRETLPSQCALQDLMNGGKTNCCTVRGQHCDRPGVPLFTSLDVGFAYTQDSMVSAETVVTQIRERRTPIPVLFARGSRAANHWVVIWGYDYDADGNMVLLIRDPEGGAMAMDRIRLGALRYARHLVPIYNLYGLRYPRRHDVAANGAGPGRRGG